MDYNYFIEHEVPECYFALALSQASINYYLLYDIWAGEPQEDDFRTFLSSELPFGEECLAKVSGLVLRCIYERDIEKSYYDEVMDFRKYLVKYATSVATYTDSFRLYDYIIARTGAATGLGSFNADAYARDILTAIFRSGDNALINDNIKFAVSQLPLRMTKVRFFDILENSLKKYIDGEESAFDRTLYMLRSSAGIFKPEAEDDFVRIESFEKEIAFFESVDFKNLDESGYDEVRKRMKRQLSMLSDLGDLLQSSMQVVNLLTILELNRIDCKTAADKDFSLVRPIVREALEGLKTNSRIETSDDTKKALIDIETRLAELIERLENNQTKAAGVAKHTDPGLFIDALKRFDMCERLLSPSTFADLEEKESGPLSAQKNEEEFKKLKNDLSEAFTGDSKPVQRARMAAVLGQIPVFFNNRTEVMHYVVDSLNACSSVREQFSAAEIIMRGLTKGTGED